MSGTRVLVAGASIAGPALAHWLRRRGAEVTVVERAPGLRPGGQAVDARGVAKEVIRRMGLDAQVRAARTVTAGAHSVDADGNVLETFSAEDDGGDGFIAEIEILRGDLSRVLYDDTRDDVEYVFGDRIVELTQDADGVDVAFEGRDRRRVDLVIGADGLHSALRAMVFGPRERFVRHLGHVLAFYSVPNEFGLDRWLIEHQENGRSAGLRPIHEAPRRWRLLLPLGRPRRRPPRRRGPEAAAARAGRRLRLEDPAPPRGPGRHPGLLPRPGRPGGDGPLVERAGRAARRRGVQLVADVRAGHRAGPGRRLRARRRAGRGRMRNPEAGFAGYEARMRSFVEANQEIGRLNAGTRDVPGPDPEPAPDFTSEWFTELIERAVTGPALPDYAGVPDSGPRTGDGSSSIGTSSASSAS